MGFRRRGSSAPSAKRATGLNSGSADTVLSGDAFKPTDGGLAPGRVLFLFNTCVGPEMPLWLDRADRVAKRLTSSAVRCARDAP